MTATADRTAVRTYERKHGTVTVTATPAGWSIVGVSKASGRVFTAEIARCECDPEHPDAGKRLRTPREPCACQVASHLGGRFCHGWHLPRVERLAEDVARTYGRGLA